MKKERNKSKAETEVASMEMIFKKYHSSEPHTEKNYLIFDPSHNQIPFTSDLCKSISHRNFIQNCENILIGPIINGEDIRVRVLTARGEEVDSDSDTRNIFRTYLRDQGYPISAYAENTASAGEPEIGSVHTEVQAFGTVYYFPA